MTISLLVASFNAESQTGPGSAYAEIFYERARAGKDSHESSAYLPIDVRD